MTCTAQFTSILKFLEGILDRLNPPRIHFYTYMHFQMQHASKEGMCTVSHSVCP